MTTSIFTSKDQRAVIALSTRESKWVSWMKRIQLPVVLATIVLVVVVGCREVASPTFMSIQWLLIALLAIFAWICRVRLAITTSVLALIPWMILEWRMANGTDVLPVQVARLIVTTGLVGWLSRLRDNLVLAERLARIDSLTGLPNRQALIESLEAEISRAKRFGRPFSLALLDCDGFKSINDRNGHLAGDEVLRRIGKSLQTNTRPFDCAGRWGGDEFLLVLSEVNHMDAEMLAERLRAGIRHDVEREYPSLAFSLGVVTFVDAGLGWEGCLRRVDQAMYSAKRSGRNETRFEVVE